MLKSFIVLIFLFLSSNAFASKVTICHVPENNPGAAHTIEVNYHALNGHLNSSGRLHGDDYFGPCKSEGYLGFYACNISMKQKDTGTLSTHDYVTYSYDSFTGNGAQNLVLEAGVNSYRALWSERTAFSRKLTSASFNLSSEVYGTDYSVDFCFDGRRFAHSSDGLNIENISFFSQRQQDLTISYKVFCDVHDRNNGIANLSQIDLSRGFPLQFNKVPEFCVVRFQVNEENDGLRRDWSRTFNQLTAIIESNLDEIDND